MSDAAASPRRRGAAAPLLRVTIGPDGVSGALVRRGEPGATCRVELPASPPELPRLLPHGPHRRAEDVLRAVVSICQGLCGEGVGADVATLELRTTCRSVLAVGRENRILTAVSFAVVKGDPLLALPDGAQAAVRRYVGIGALVVHRLTRAPPGARRSADGPCHRRLRRGLGLVGRPRRAGHSLPHARPSGRRDGPARAHSGPPSVAARVHADPQPESGLGGLTPRRRRRRPASFPAAA